MARMSIDDSALRDPRVMRLAKRRGWSRRETIGALLDVWAVAYDRANDTLPQEDIDIAAGDDNFACDMVVVGLADTVDGGVRIRGAAERIEYLLEQHDSKVRAGTRGGIRSGEARRARSQSASFSASHEMVSASEAGRSRGEAEGEAPNGDTKLAESNHEDGICSASKQCFVENPAERSSPVPDPPPVLPIPVALSRRAKRSPETPMPADWRTTPEHLELAKKRGVDLEHEAQAFRLHAEAHDRRCVRWNAAFSQWLLRARPQPGAGTKTYKAPAPKDDELPFGCDPGTT